MRIGEMLMTYSESEAEHDDVSGIIYCVSPDCLTWQILTAAECAGFIWLKSSSSAKLCV